MHPSFIWVVDNAESIRYLCARLQVTKHNFDILPCNTLVSNSERIFTLSLNLYYYLINSIDTSQHDFFLLTLLDEKTIEMRQRPMLRNGNREFLEWTSNNTTLLQQDHLNMHSYIVSFMCILGETLVAQQIQ